MSWPCGANRLRTAAVALVVAALAFPLRGYSASHAGPTPGSSAYFDPQAEEELLALTNHARAGYNLPPLRVDERLTQAARKHSALMAQRSQMEHQLPGEPSLPIRTANEHMPANEMSENIAFSNRNVVEAHEGLMHSPPHRRAILAPDYDFIGIGVLRDGEDIWITEDFARKLPEYSEAQAESAVQAAIVRYAESHRLYPPARKQEPQLRQLACNMARADRVSGQDALNLPGVRNVLAWTADDPGQLPKGIAHLLSGQTSADALGVCLAPSRSHPGGVYWIVMVTY